MFDIQRCINVIKEDGYKKVCLQFPDSLLNLSPSISELLKVETEANIYITADTSYGSCCIDEVAADHVDADLIIHYGHSCRSRPSRIPTLFVFERKELDLQPLINEFLTKCTIDKKYIFMYDDSFHHCIENIKQSLSDAGIIGVFPRIDLYVKPNEEVSESFIDYNGCEFGIDQLKDYNLFYIGDDSAAKMNALLRFTLSECYSYSPTNSNISSESVHSNKLLRKRMYLIEKVKNCGIFGILVGSLSVSSYMKVVERLQKIISKNNRKSYVVVVGKVSVAKLANFMEIEAFVMVSCPENSLIDSREFCQPIVTPIELMLALEGDYSSLFWKVQFDEFLACKFEEEGDVDDLDDENTQEASRGIVSTRRSHQMIQYSKDAASFLSSRVYKGLDLDLENRNLDLVQGRTGIAKGYHNEM